MRGVIRQFFRTFEVALAFFEGVSLNERLLPLPPAIRLSAQWGYGTLLFEYIGRLDMGFMGTIIHMDDCARIEIKVELYAISNASCLLYCFPKL